MEIRGAVDAFEALDAAVVETQKAFDAGLWQVSEDAVLELTRRHQAVLSRVQSMGLALIREAEARSIPATVGATSTAAFLSGALRMSPGFAGEQAKMAAALAEKCRDTGAALAAGEISYEQARAITRAVEGLPERASAQQRLDAEAMLLENCGVLNALDIGKLHKKLAEVIDPDGVEPREEDAKKKRAANIRDHFDGTQSIHWRDTDENMALVKAAMSSLDAPVPGPDGERDERTPAIRRADALLDICRRALDSGELPITRGATPHLNVTFSEDTLRGKPGHGFGRAASGEHVSFAAIRRLACDADIRGILLDGHGVPLKLGYSRRTISPGQWIALVARDLGCQFPNCARPAHMCQAHHRIHWIDDGPSDLENFVLLCHHHHDSVHHGGWDIALGDDGRPVFLPPAWVDPAREPRVNLHWRRQRDLTNEPLDLDLSADRPSAPESEPDPQPPPDPAPDP